MFSEIMCTPKVSMEEAQHASKFSPQVFFKAPQYFRVQLFYIKKRS